MLPDDVQLAEGYRSIADIAENVIENSADAQDCTAEELSIVPITAIDEVEMSNAIANSDTVSQESWDMMREYISSEVASRGYKVN